jgi:hypothetical protein
MATNEVKSVVHAVLNGAREQCETWKDIVALARKTIDLQSPEMCGLDPDALRIYNPGRCPHESLLELWDALEQACSEDGEESYLEGEDLDKIIAFVPGWLPAWAKRMMEKEEIERVPCECCQGRGWIERKKG